jgi:hypothetical protein
VTVNVYEPSARPLYEAPELDPNFPSATGVSQGPEDDVGPERSQLSDLVAFGLRL